MSKKNKFNNIWKSQTNVGKLFGLSAIKVGQELIKFNLKDPISKKATEKAINEGFAKETPLKDGTEFYMWNIQKIKPLLQQNTKLLTKEEQYINNATECRNKAETEIKNGNDKIAYMVVEAFLDDVPKEYKENIEKIFNNF